MYNESEFLKLVKKSKRTKVLYNHNGVYVLKVTTFDDCERLFNWDTIEWCIADNIDHWNDYVKMPDNDQYFVVDFNFINSDSTYDYNQAFIGFTLNKDRMLCAAHGRNDINLLHKDIDGVLLFYKWLRRKGIYDFVVNKNMQGENVEIEETSNHMMYPVYFLIGSILVAMMTLFIRCG